MNKPQKALIVVTSHSVLGTLGRPTGFYLPEVTHPYYALKDAGFTVDIASPQGGAAPMDPKSRDLNDPENKRFLETPEDAVKLDRTLKLGDIDVRQYGAILFAGGHGTMWDFADSKDVQRTAAAIYEAGGIVAAVCHGPAALVNVRLSNGAYLVAGKRVSTFTDDEERAVKLENVVPFLLESTLRERGAIIEKAGLWQPKVSVDGRLVTGQNPASAQGVGQEVAKLLKAQAQSAAAQK